MLLQLARQLRALLGEHGWHASMHECTSKLYGLTHVACRTGMRSMAQLAWVLQEEPSIYSCQKCHAINAQNHMQRGTRSKAPRSPGDCRRGLQAAAQAPSHALGLTTSEGAESEASHVRALCLQLRLPTEDMHLLPKHCHRGVLRRRRRLLRLLLGQRWCCLLLLTV